jgi:hypothetical protein
MGVSAFGNLAPAAFGAFDRAFITMFRILAGDTWVRCFGHHCNQRLQ